MFLPGESHVSSRKPAVEAHKAGCSGLLPSGEQTEGGKRFKCRCCEVLFTVHCPSTFQDELSYQTLNIGFRVSLPSMVDSQNEVII